VLVESWDPYKHLATSHPVHRENQDRASDWFGFTSIQDWRSTQHSLMLEDREIQKKTGRIIPQTNEEYGYEDHYPHWRPGRGRIRRRRCARWLGKSPWLEPTALWARVTAVARTSGLPSHGGVLYRFRMVEDRTARRTRDHGAWCLAKPGEIYAIYLPKEGNVIVKLDPGTYRATWFSAFTGERIPLQPVQGPSWTSPKTPGWLDWALLLERQR